MRDLIVIGAGPGGYTAAIRAAQKGLSVTLIEEKFLGGVCLNVGCIPSKTLLSLKLGEEKVFEKIAGVVQKGRDGLDYLMKKNKVEVIQGKAQLKNNEIFIDQKKYEGKSILLATGSSPVEIFPKSPRILTTNEIFSLQVLPKTLLIIGAGVIGLELAQAFTTLGVKVFLVDLTPLPLFQLDQDLSQEVYKIFQNQMTFYLENKVKTLQEDKDGVQVILEKGQEFKVDIVLQAIGRKPNTKDFSLDKDEKGFLKVNDFFQTSVKNIYAIGDLIDPLFLAHRAEGEGRFIGEFLAGEKPQKEHHIPSVVYTDPEIASIGLQEREIKVAYKKGIYPLKFNGKARANFREEGFVKILADKKTDEILGAHLLGPHVGEMIFGLQIAMSYRATCEDLVRCSFPHPTLSESIKEACSLAWEGKTINL